jgi:hypothetical protein
MTSNKQIEANTENSKLGGVKTTEGKEVSKFNAVKHGIFRQTITEYESDFYSDIFLQLKEQLLPEGILEEILVERIATCYVKLYRVAKSEQEHIKASIHPEGLHIHLMGDEDTYAPQIKTATVSVLVNLFARYEVTTENRLYKAMHELERIQRIRKGEKINAPLAIDVNKMGLFGEIG